MSISSTSSALAPAIQATQQGQQSLASIKQNLAAEKAVADTITEATNKARDLSAAQGRGQVLDIEV